MNNAKDPGELIINLRMKGRPVVLVGEGAAADEHRSLLTRAGAVLVGEGSKATFAVVIDDRAAVSRLKVRGALVYAVGEPDLCDFTFANAAAPAKITRKAKPTPEADHRAIPEPAIAQVPRAAKVRQEPKLQAPREPFKMPNISLDPARSALNAAMRWIGTMWQRTRAMLAPLMRASTPLTRTVASTIQSRVDRARERPISLDMALVKGGPLDEQGQAGEPEPQGTQGTGQ